METKMFVDYINNGVVYFKNEKGTIECPKQFLILTHTGSTEETLIGPRAMMGGEVMGPNRAGMAPAGLPGLPPLNSSSKYYSDCEGKGYLLCGGILYFFVIELSRVDQWSKSWSAWIKSTPYGVDKGGENFTTITADGDISGWCNSLSVTRNPVISEFGMTVMDFLQSIREHNRACRAKTILEFSESPSKILESVGFSTDDAKYNKSAKVIAVGDAELIIFEAGANLGYSDMFLVRKNREHGWPEAFQMGQMGWVALGHQGAQDIISKMPRGAQRYKGIVSTVLDPVFIKPENETADIEVRFSIPKRCLGFVSEHEGGQYLVGVRGRAYGFVTEDRKAVVSPETIVWLGESTDARPAFSLMWGIPTDFEGEFIFHGQNLFLAEKRGNVIYVPSELAAEELGSWTLADQFSVVIGEPPQKVVEVTDDEQPITVRKPRKPVVRRK